MGILRDQTNRLKNDSWYKKLRRWLKFKLWLWKKRNKMTNLERFHKLVSAEATNTIERAKQRIAKRKAMKIDQEEFNRKAQHIIETVVKPQVARYEKAKAQGTLRRLTEEMKRDTWHVKLRRWWRLQRWVWVCRTRWIWDLQYEHNIFRKKQ
jgi:hypothetical protein